MLNNNLFNQEFESFKETNYFKLLDGKYKPIPYYKKYKMIQRITFVASYLFNFLSAFTASSLVYFFILSIAHIEQVALAAALLFVVLLEMMKRKLSSLIYKEFLMTRRKFLFPTTILLILSIMSISSSYYGSKKIVVEYSDAPELVQKDVSNLEKQIALLDIQIDEARDTKWKGTTTPVSQETINSLSIQKEKLLSELIRNSEQTDNSNHNLITNHVQMVQKSASYFALVTLLLELLFLISTYYLEYYDYRSYLEFLRPIVDDRREQEPDIKEEPYTENIDPSILIAAIKNAKANLAAYQSKLRKGSGTIKANQKGIKRWEARLRELEDLLPKNGIEKNDKGSDNENIATLF